MGLFQNVTVALLLSPFARVEERRARPDPSLRNATLEEAGVPDSGHGFMQSVATMKADLEEVVRSGRRLFDGSARRKSARNAANKFVTASPPPPPSMADSAKEHIGWLERYIGAIWPGTKPATRPGERPKDLVTTVQMMKEDMDQIESFRRLSQQAGGRGHGWADAA